MTAGGNSNETANKSADRNQIAIHDPQTAGSIFSSINLEGNDELSEDFKANVKILSQLYDAIQRYLMGLYKKGDSFFPNSDDIYNDLQLFKRTISDKAPMPSKEELEYLTFILAGETIPFIHIYRELEMEPSGKLRGVTRYVAPTEKHPDKPAVSVQSFIRNSSLVMKEFIMRNASGYPWEGFLDPSQEPDKINLRPGRADHILSVLYIRPQGKKTDNRTVLRLKKINSNIQRRVLMPLLQQLIREQQVISFSCKEVRTRIPGQEKIPDIFLLSEKDQLMRRYEKVRGILDSPWAIEAQDSHLRKDLEVRLEKGEITLDEFFHRLSGGILESMSTNAEKAPWLLEPSLEVNNLSAWKMNFEKEKTRQEEKDAMRGIIDRLQKAGTVFQAKQGRNYAIPERFIKLILNGKMPGILIALDPFDLPEGGVQDLDLYENIFLILKDRRITGKAVETAEELFEKNDDVYLIRVLENLFGIGFIPEHKLKEFVAPAYIERFRRLMKRSYVRYLPWVHRVWLTISSGEIRDEKLSRLQHQKRTENSSLLKKKQRKAEVEDRASGRRQVRELAEQRLRGESQGGPDASQDVQRGIIAYIDSSWARGQFPEGPDIIRGLSQEAREEGEKTLELAALGAATVKDIICIPISGGEKIYASAAYLKEHHESILSRCQSKLEDKNEIQIGDKIMQRKGVKPKNIHIYEAVLNYIRRHY